MTTARKVAAFVVSLLAVFAVAVWVGKASGPRVEVEVAHADGHAQGHDAAPVAPELPGGLQSTQGGYTLDLTKPVTVAAAKAPLHFRIVDAQGAPVTRYTENHEKLLHLVVVRNDLSRFQHVHPILHTDGTWSVSTDLSRAGDYRVFADFIPAGGPALTLGTNLHVAGQYNPQPLPAQAPSAEVDGYTVALRGTPKTGESSLLTLSVSRDGRPVTDLQPYLGAYGHLVALRAADLAYLHVHPAGEPGDGKTPSGPDIGFHTTFPSAGDYRLYLDFQHGDVVRTAEFTVTVGEPGHGH
ncbi:hypothetical protein [Mycobacterium deserti]|uniref:Secreted protein n=1 Tax=Mycobacterium deserti TaxID=2978347 RepID=A0ABT2M3R0_9MYCO|nr:hypothetical protein [Mycobacterium deserti]MCT7656897.1 hypothetical protein [Mycobacterium deserti]